MYSFSLIRIFSHRVFPNEVFNEASPHCGSKGVNPRPPVADIIRHALLYSSSPRYTRLKEWGTGRAGDLAPSLPKKQKFKILQGLPLAPTTSSYHIHIQLPHRPAHIHSSPALRPVVMVSSLRPSAEDSLTGLPQSGLANGTGSSAWESGRGASATTAVYSPDDDRSAHSSTLFRLEYSRLREWGTPDRVYRLGPPGLTTIGPGQRPTYAQ
ncbi:unnamed protein product [Cuscuta epithymum]|uniref:Uncharacterized protein n=1 Tax=Cuscuta epithymum TaxID=186058 RepID=A0AAV0FP39_9ASTE|nr:unnamed protein product [Cuscuta epithymum]